jgi:hypothetical protein
MHTFLRFLIPFLLMGCLQHLEAQDDYQQKIRDLKALRERVEKEEKEALKQEVLRIEERLKAGEVTVGEARELKEAAARKHALNIENRLAMIDNEIALLERNRGFGMGGEDPLGDSSRHPGQDEPWHDDCRVLGIDCYFWDDDHPRPYDRRTYSDLVIAFGFNNALIEGQSLEDSPYRLGGSRFFEIGWAWRTRVFRHSNFMRVHYGFSFQFNGLKPEGNQIFVTDAGGQTSLEDFPFDLRKSKFRTDNLVFPVHLEFGPSRKRQSEHHIRYSLRNQFRFAVGGYGGVNLGARQKLKYSVDGDRKKDKLKGGYNTSDLIYGLSAYMGVDGFLLYVKYDLNPIFQDAAVEQRNISLGLRFDL